MRAYKLQSNSLERKSPVDIDNLHIIRIVFCVIYFGWWVYLFAESGWRVFYSIARFLTWWGLVISTAYIYFVTISQYDK